MKPVMKSRTQSRKGFRFKERLKREKKVAFVAVIVLASAAIVFAMGARERRPTTVSRPASLPQAQPARKVGRLHSRLSLQPEADRMRRRLGQRFLASGREVTVMTGMLTIGTDRQPVRVTRTMDDDGERIEVAVGGRGSVLTWDQTAGASSSGRAAAGTDRSVVERLALDSVDEFIMAQLRGGSYYTVARNVRPAEAGDSEDYAGPVWDVVRVAETDDNANVRAQSPWRLYLINSVTGLLEKVVSKEPGGDVTAEISEWGNRGGEVMPGHIVWKQNGQVVMELTLNGITNGPKQ